jgi:hypothetical protein
VSLPPPSGEQADSRSAGPPPTEVGPAELDAARPRSVRIVREAGAVVNLAWTNGSGGYPVVVQATSTGGQSVVTPVPDGAGSVELTGLDPDGGYCFLVTAVLSATPLTTAPSDPPVCIRGAYVRD